LMQLPATSQLIRERLGPVSLLVAEENVPALRQQIELLQQNVQDLG
jgi:hypothetical protein